MRPRPVELIALGVGLREAVQLTVSWLTDAQISTFAAVVRDTHAGPLAATTAAGCIWDEWEGAGAPPFADWVRERLDKAE